MSDANYYRMVMFFAYALLQVVERDLFILEEYPDLDRESVEDATSLL